MKSLICAGFALVWTALSANAQQLSVDDLARRIIERRAVEAAIWGIPAVSMAGVRKSLAGIGADFNQVVYFSQPLEARHEFLTANNQTPYVMTVLDLRRGPVVVDVPPASSKVALFGSAIDSWQVPLVDLGPSGDDAGKGGKYLFLPPGYTGSRPDGHIVIASPTNFVHAALRPIILGQGTLADGVTYSQTLKVYPLAEAANPPPTRYVDAYPKPWKTLPVYDLTYFRDLAAVVNDEPPQERDAVMLGLLASIGIEKGKPFNPTGEDARAFERAVQQAYAEMQDLLHDARQGARSALAGPPVDGNTPYSEAGLHVRGRWQIAGGRTRRRLWTFCDVATEEAGRRQRLSHMLRDGAGKLLSGQSSYRLRVPADTPARDFWSVIVYSMKTKSMIPNPQNRGGLSSYDKSKLAMNADGSADLYFGPTAPAGKEVELASNRRRLLPDPSALRTRQGLFRQDVENE